MRACVCVRVCLCVCVGSVCLATCLSAIASVSTANSTLRITPTSQNVTEGNPAIINCSHTGFVSKNVTTTYWLKMNSSKIIANGASMRINHTVRNDTGSYKCIVSNGTMNWTEVASINVQCKFMAVRSTVSSIIRTTFLWYNIISNKVDYKWVHSLKYNWTVSLPKLWQEICPKMIFFSL